MLLNVTNPMAMCCMALDRMVPEVRTIGLCHSTWMTAATVAGLLEIPVEELDFAGAGVNHQVFISRLEQDGVDVYPRLRALAASDHPFARSVRGDFVRRFGYMVTESSKHNAGVPAVVPAVGRAGRNRSVWCRTRTGSAGRRTQEWFALATDVAAGRRPVRADRKSSASTHPRSSARWSTGRATLYANVPNRTPDGGRLVDELPDWGVVEVPATCDADGVHPRRPDGTAVQCHWSSLNSTSWLSKNLPL